MRRIDSDGETPTGSICMVLEDRVRAKSSAAKRLSAEVTELAVLLGRLLS